MTDKNFIVKLSSNSNISFEIQPEFCACGRPMCLHKTGEGKVFWCCKGFNSDPKKNKCDLKKDLKCFRCGEGEIVKKINSNTKENFYGCTNFSEVSVSACNFTIGLGDMNDVIKQVNDAIKFRYNFKSLIYNDADEKRWNLYKKQVEDKKTEKKQNNKNDCSLERAEEAGKWIDVIKNIFHHESKKDSKKSDNTVSKFPIPPKLARLAVVGLLALAFLGVVSGSGVKLDLFQGMFKIEIGPKIATSDNVSFAFNAETGQLVVQNKDKKGAVDLSDVELKDDEGNVLLSFDDLPSDEKILGKGETMSIDQNELFAMMKDEEEKSEDEGGLFDYIFDSEENYVEMPSEVEPSEPFDSNRDLPDYYEEESKLQRFVDALSSQKIEFVVDAIEDGKRVYEEMRVNIYESAEAKLESLRADLEQKRDEIINQYVEEYGDIPAVIKLKDEYYQGDLTPERIEELKIAVERLEEILKERQEEESGISEDELMRRRIDREIFLNQ